jgi:putative ABC transport system ATP-binding protein
MVYQQPYWIKSLTVLENVAFPLLLLGRGKKEALKKAEEMISLVEMQEWAGYIPTELSSGQQQRVNLARALSGDPQILIVDEPTGNLDYESGVDLMKLLTKFNQQGKSILMVTHDLEFITFAGQAVKMFNGKISEIYRGEKKEELMKDLRGKRGNGAWNV